MHFMYLYLLDAENDECQRTDYLLTFSVFVLYCIVLYCIVLYLYIYIALPAVHTNQKRFQCERPREKRTVLLRTATANPGSSRRPSPLPQADDAFCTFPLCPQKIINFSHISAKFINLPLFSVNL